MKPILLFAAFLFPCAALAGGSSDCPKGSNVKLTDNTTSSSQTAPATQTSGSGSTETDRGGFKNHFPH